MITFVQRTGTAPGTLTLLGQAEPTPDYDLTMAALELKRSALATLQAEEELKRARADRIISAVTALVSVGSLIVAIIALKKR